MAQFWRNDSLSVSRIGQEAFVGVNPIKQIIKELTQQCPRSPNTYFLSKLFVHISSTRRANIKYVVSKNGPQLLGYLLLYHDGTGEKPAGYQLIL